MIGGSMTLLVVGDHGAGKSALILRYFDNCFIPGYSGPRFSGLQDPKRAFWSPLNKTLRINGPGSIDDGDILLSVFDRKPGHYSKYLFGDLGYSRDARGILLCFDLTDRESFIKLPEWLEGYKREFRANPPKLVLVGCKSDLLTSTVVDIEEVQKFADENKLIYIETTAQSNKNVQKALETVFSMMLNANVQSITLREFKTIVDNHFNEYILNMRNNATGIFSSFVRQPDWEYSLQEKYRSEIYHKHFHSNSASSNKKSENTEQAFIQDTLLLISEIQKKHKQENPFYSTCFSNRLCSMLTNTLNELSQKSSVLKGYIEVASPSQGSRRNYSLV